MKVIHFVTGGFSGATSVAIELVRAAQARGSSQSMLVLRRKSSTQAARVDALRAEGLRVELVPGWPHAATVWSLARLCRRARPDVLMAHGFPEHILGRWAGLAANVPHLVQVEHNCRERYTAWRLAQSRWLARSTDRIVGVSEDVRSVLLSLGMPADKTLAIANGISLERFASADDRPFESREPGIVMAARFAKQKDHATVLHALHQLRADGLTPPLLLAGSGGNRHERAAKALCAELRLEDQVRFLGHVGDLPSLLMRHRIALLSSHYEGFGLSLAEGMAAGCAAIGTDVPGIRTLIRDGVDGLLVSHEDPTSLARAIKRLLLDLPFASSLARAGRMHAKSTFAREIMLLRYEQLLEDLLRGETR
jgi:glycosyltransferase involved in cell wall biosynthesis